jgi:hypothetical protein
MSSSINGAEKDEKGNAVRKNPLLKSPHGIHVHLQIQNDASGIHALEEIKRILAFAVHVMDEIKLQQIQILPALAF